MGNNVKSQRAAGRVTAKDHIRRVLAEGRNNITDRFDALLELMRIDRLGGGCILNDNNGKVVIVLRESLLHLPTELEMAGRERDGITTTLQMELDSSRLSNRLKCSYPQRTQECPEPTDSQSRNPLRRGEAGPHLDRTLFALRKPDIVGQLLASKI